MIKFKISPALGLALIVAIVSLLAVVQSTLAAEKIGTKVANTTAPKAAQIALNPNLLNLSQVHGDLAYTWINRRTLTGVLTATSETGNPIQDALGCTCAICTGIQV